MSDGRASERDDWEAATYEGVERVRARAIARTTPQQRFDWLMEALMLAEVSGALGRARADKQAWCDRVWDGAEETPALAPAGGVHELLAQARSSTDQAPPVLSAERAEELVTEVRAARDGQ